MGYQLIKDKFLKNTLMIKSDELKSHIPEFAIYSKNEMKRLLNKYGIVYLKPQRGRLSRGVMQVVLNKDGLVTVMNAGGKMKTLNLSEFPEWSVDPYIVEQGIDGMKYKKKNVDIRIYLQKINESWSVEGTVCKIAKKNRFSPSSEQGARYKNFSTVFKWDLDLYNSIQSLSKVGVTHLSYYLSGLRIAGIDIKVDCNKKIWIIEVNTNPLRGAFKGIDPELYYRLEEQKEMLFAKEESKTLKSLFGEDEMENVPDGKE